MLFRRLVQRTAGVGHFAGRNWEPRNEAQFVPRTVLKRIVVLAVANIELVLHTHDIYSLARPFNLPWLHLGQANVPDFALLLKLLDRPERLFDRHLRINAVQLP